MCLPREDIAPGEGTKALRRTPYLISFIFQTGFSFFLNSELCNSGNVGAWERRINCLHGKGREWDFGSWEFHRLWILCVNFLALLIALTDSFCLTVCPNLTTLNESSGVITSPFYPRYYPNNQRCRWKIMASKRKRIVLDIEYMHIKNCRDCLCDYLEIESGSSSDGVSAGRRCGYKYRPFAYFSLRESLKVLFVSDGIRSWYRGFRATYTQVNHTGKL